MRVSGNNITMDCHDTRFIWKISKKYALMHLNHFNGRGDGSEKTNRLGFLLTDICSLMFVLLFVYAAISKLSDFEKFKNQIGKSPILYPFISFVSIGIPCGELLLAVLLSIRKYQLFALYSSFTLMCLFSVYIVSILHFATYIPCSCGGVLQNMTWSQHLVFNFMYLTIAIAAILFYPDKNKSL